VRNAVAEAAGVARRSAAQRSSAMLFDATKTRSKYRFGEHGS